MSHITIYMWTHTYIFRNVTLGDRPVRMSHVIWNESCPTLLYIYVNTHTLYSLTWLWETGLYVWVMSYEMSHVPHYCIYMWTHTHVFHMSYETSHIIWNESCLTLLCVHVHTHMRYELFMEGTCHLLKCHVTYWNDISHAIPMSHGTCEWVMAHVNESWHIWRSHGTYVMAHMNESWHLWMSHGTYK